jgi:hypothetical protein
MQSTRLSTCFTPTQPPGLSAHRLIRKCDIVEVMSGGAVAVLAVAQPICVIEVRNCIRVQGQSVVLLLLRLKHSSSMLKTDL